MRTAVMGIVNVTPDSFSDGGRWNDPERAIAFGRRLVDEGATILDIGGESTRPGARPVDTEVELARVLPVISALAGRVPAEISVDTTKPEVARAAAAAGATILNDVSGSLEAVAAETGMGWVAMHRRGPSATMQDDPRYDDVVAEVRAHLADCLDRAEAVGVDRVWIDPGFGFGKTTRHNLELLAHLDEFVALAPVLVGVSRKRSIGELTAASDGVDAVGADDRLEGSLAWAVWAAELGASVVRVHDVAPTVEALAVVGEPRGVVVGPPGCSGVGGETR
ncbi:MAG: dihydropteroate synthase [Actinomyces sp.]|nr:MAG: dihydropteroate synthase [Actinomyces sp.]